MTASERPEHAIDPTPAGWHAEVSRFETNGEFFKGYDVAMQGLAQFPDDPWLAHRAVLCLTNAGALQLARRRYDEFNLARRNDTEFVALDARLLKSEASRASGPKRRELLLAALERYSGAYARAKQVGSSDAYYPGINVATLHLLTGNPDAAAATAREVLAAIDRGLADQPLEDRADAYWVIATAIEAHIIVGDLAAAKTLAGPALRANASRYAELASTARQLRLVLAAKSLDLSWLGEFAPPEVVHYTGHIIAAPGAGSRIAAEAEPELVAKIARALEPLRVGTAYGSLAAGADILFAEALLARGVSLNIALPFAKADFIAQSVAPSGEGWVARFERCLEQASTVRFATDDRHLGDEQLYFYCSQLAMGLAVLCARHSCAQARQLALWDGRAPDVQAGTAADMAVWRRAQLPQTVIRHGTGPEQDLSALGRMKPARVGRGTRAMLFGDIKGFSKLTDAEIPAFTETVLGTLGRVIDAFADSVAFVNTWGDGLFVVFEDASAAARCALALQSAMAEVDLRAAGLPPSLSLRLGGHLGPVYRVDDPVLHRPNYMGAHVSRAARIEPITPEGCVYVTETFAAVLALYNADQFACDYVGMTEMAKSYGLMRMFLLRPAIDAADGPPTLRQVQ